VVRKAEKNLRQTENSQFKLRLFRVYQPLTSISRQKLNFLREASNTTIVDSTQHLLSFPPSPLATRNSPPATNPGWYIDEVQLVHDFGCAFARLSYRSDAGFSLPPGRGFFQFPSRERPLHPPASLSNPVLTTEGCWSGCSQFMV
jgi:hypothetical protein